MERLVLVVCRWAWAAEALMQPAIRVAREACAEMRCLTTVLKGWRQVVARGGHERATELRALHRSWAAGTWATLPAIQLAGRHAWESPRAQQWRAMAVDPRVRYREMLLLPPALPRWCGVFGALREVWLEDVPLPTCEPSWTAERWWAICKIINVRRRVLGPGRGGVDQVPCGSWFARPFGSACGTPQGWAEIEAGGGD